MDVTAFRARYLYQPHEVSIETLTLCNARCTFCPYPTLERIGTKLPDQIMLDLIEQMSGWSNPFFVSPFKVNEPFLDHRLRYFCQRIVARCPNATLRLFTNGQPLTSGHLEWIAELPAGRLKHLWISLNSTDKIEYERLMDIDFDLTVRRLNTLHARVVAGDFPHPVVLSRVMQDDVSTNQKFWEDCRERWPRFIRQFIKRDGWLGYVDPLYKDIPHSPCGRWFELNVMADGKVALCCMDGKGEYAIGDVKQTPLLKIYNQPHLLDRREFSANRKGIDPCERCTY